MTPSDVPSVAYQDAPQRTHLTPSGPFRAWVPVPLRLWFWIPFFTGLVLVAIALEVALHFSNKNSGFAIPSHISPYGNTLHYLITIPLSLLAMIIVSTWAGTDIEMKRLQPYVDLVHGDSPPERSIFLDYTRQSKFMSLARAWSNGHTLIVITSLVVLMCIALQPLAGALLEVRDTPWDPQDNFVVNNLAAIGLNQNPDFTDLAGFLTAAGYASSAILYNLTDPPFTHQAWTLGKFDMPSYLGRNGSFSVNTSAILSDPGCVAAQPITFITLPGNAGWNATVTSQDCYVTWSIDMNTTETFGTDILQCGPTDFSAAALRPVVFWFFTFLPEVASKAVICNPTISLYDVNVELNLVTSAITTVTILENFTTGHSPFSSVSGNVTGPPLNGSAFNGIGFNLSTPNEVDISRGQAIQLQLPAAMFEYAKRSLNGSDSIYNSNAIVAMSERVYTTYLKLLAQTAYFLPVSESMNMHVTLILKRLWVSTAAAHALAAILILIAVLGTLVQLAHRVEREYVLLAHQPGTIACAVSVGGQTHVGELLAGRQRGEDIEAATQNKKFRIDPQTMQIVSNDEPGYDTVPRVERRRSVFQQLAQRRTSVVHSDTGELSPKE